MEQSILKTTKKILGLADEYTAFDFDVITHINAALGVVFQIGAIAEPFTIEDDTSLWTEITASPAIINVMKTYVWLWVRLNFDPPNTSYASQAAKEQLREYEWRLYALRDNELITAAEEAAAEDEEVCP